MWSNHRWFQHPLQQYIYTANKTSPLSSLLRPFSLTDCINTSLFYFHFQPLLHHTFWKGFFRTKLGNLIKTCLCAKQKSKQATLVRQKCQVLVTPVVCCSFLPSPNAPVTCQKTLLWVQRVLFVQFYRQERRVLTKPWQCTALVHRHRNELAYTHSVRLYNIIYSRSLHQDAHKSGETIINHSNATIASYQCRSHKKMGARNIGNEIIMRNINITKWINAEADWRGQARAS